MKAERDIGFGPGRRSNRLLNHQGGPRKAAKAVQPQRRGERESRTLLRRRRLYQLRRMGRIAILVLLVAGGMIAYRTGLADATFTELRGQFAAGAVDLGFVVRRIEVNGAAQTDEGALHAALGIRKGDPIFAFDMDEARARVSALGWVKSVAVGRQLPDGVVIDIVERRPIAIWQLDGAFRMIDRDGVVITDQDLGRFAALPVVVGSGAETAAASLIDVLGTEPELKKRLRAAVRVGQRRWDIVFDTGMRARLPETGEARAWHRLAALARKHDLLNRAVHVVDLRQEDRLVLRLTERAAELQRSRHDETGKGGAV